MWAWLLKIAAWMATSPIIKAIILGFLEDLKNEGQKMVPVIEQICKDAMAKTDLNGPQKFEWVVSQVAAAFPAATSDLVRQMVQTVWTYIVGPEVVSGTPVVPPTA